MRHSNKMELVLVALSSVLCLILLLKLLYSLRSILVWRVNCWFCNNYFWVIFIKRNSWNCPNCEQYNGFTKDGDYNKPLFIVNEATHKSPKVFRRSPPKNGLCKICNINQETKVTQLANFVGSNEKNFEREIEIYRMQLEKAYKLCSPCKKVVQLKLNKEKEILLGTKCLENRSIGKNNQRENDMQNKLQRFINNTSMFIAGLILILLSFECYKLVAKHKNFFSTLSSLKEFLTGLFDRLTSIIKMKAILTFPSLGNYLVDFNDVYNYNLDIWKQVQFQSKYLKDTNEKSQRVLGGFATLIQIVGVTWNLNKMKHMIIINLLWLIFMVTSIAHHYVILDSTIICLVKISSMGAVLLVYRNIKHKIKDKWKPFENKHCMSKTANSMCEDVDIDVGTDDDVSLSKFGLHNFSDSSSETLTAKKSLFEGRAFKPRSESLWAQPKFNTALKKSPSSVSDTVFAKPIYKCYQKMAKDDSDSDLDESISSLSIGSPKKSARTNSIFSLRKFTATPNFLVPTPLNRKPLISPSKLGHSTSWVAGGYWGTEGERQIFNVNGSRSSSQSSGFESQASSLTHRNVFSQPPSREESVCGDPDRTSVLLDRFNCNMNFSSPQNFGHSNPQKYSSNLQSFGRVSLPVFPQMQFNNHVHIPQARFAQTSNVFIPQHNKFKTPGESGLIKLPRI